MKASRSLSDLNWTLSGWQPQVWRTVQSAEVGASPSAEVRAVPAKVPGSVQGALRDAGILPDWNVGLKFRECQWVENLHWIYEAALPDDGAEPGRTVRLVCMGLDYSGWVLLNGEEIGEFRGTHVPHVFDLSSRLKESGNVLRIVFDVSPRWLGQFGYTSRITEWKTRFNYTWDWIPRLVQIGPWEEMRLEITDGAEIAEFLSVGDAEVDSGKGILTLQGDALAEEGGTIRLTLSRDGSVLREETVSPSLFAEGIVWRDLPVDLWQPNLEGEHPLYEATAALLDSSGAEHDRRTHRVGFRHIEWTPCEGAPEGADPWLCRVNGRPIFLQGVNFPPLLPNYADATEADYRKRILLYQELGVNVFRVNGVGYLEKEIFYDICDECGILVWQDLPLSSSGLDNEPPRDARSSEEVAEILESFIRRRRHHASLFLWCGGNELMTTSEGRIVPLNDSHPMTARLRPVAETSDPTRRFIPSTPTGPRVHFDPAEAGKGVHWNVHGPWKPTADLAEWEAYWSSEDSLFRAETGAPGASPVEILEKYAGDLPLMPVSPESALWSRPVTWWIEADVFAAEHGREPESLEEYVAWSQERQAKALVIAVGRMKSRFPKAGGILLWCGHDCYPCASNTSILDFHGNPKPAALALKAVWRGRAGER